jgi:hypothetical protein
MTNEQPYPAKIIPTIKSDMMAYHKHHYSFKDFCERNTNGRNYGTALISLWEQSLSEYKEKENG